MNAELVHCGVREGVATLTLDDPPANGYSHAMMRALDDAVVRLRFDDAVHVIVVTGAGDRFFCAGAQIGMLSEASESFKFAFCLHANETLLRLEHTPKLVIAALNGHAVGGGLEIALACDLRIAKRGDVKIGLPEVGLGLLPGTGGTQRLARTVGKSRALAMMVKGENLTLDQAEAIGLIHGQLDAEGFAGKAQDYARQFCPPRKAPLAVGAIKRAVQSGAEMPLESGLALERELQARLFASTDARAGIGAWLQKKPPEFSGR